MVRILSSCENDRWKRELGGIGIRSFAGEMWKCGKVENRKVKTKKGARAGGAARKVSAARGALGSQRLGETAAEGNK